MAAIQPFTRFCRVGRQSDRTTVCPFRTVGTATSGTVTTDVNNAISSSTVTLKVTGGDVTNGYTTISIGDIIVFGNHATEYRATAGATLDATGVVVSITPVLTSAVDGSGTPVGATVSEGNYEDSSYANRWFDLALSPDGLQGAGGSPSEVIPTQHRTRGALYVVDGARNRSPGTLQLPLTPEHTKFIMDLSTALTSNNLDFYTIEEYWTDTITGGDIGRRLAGCVFSGYSLSVDRTADGAAGVLSVNLNFFINQDVPIPSGSLPAFTASAVDPYQASYARVDFSKTTTNFGGDLAAVRSFDFNFSQNANIDDSRPSATASLDGAWTTVNLGNPSLGMGVRFRLDDDAFLDWQRERPKSTFHARIAVGYGAPTYTETLTTPTLTTSGVQNITGGDVTGLANGDVVLLVAVDDTLFTTGIVSNLNTGADTYDIDASDVASTGLNFTVSNGAFEIEIPRMEIATPGNPTGGDNDVEITHQFEAQLLAGETELHTLKTYNDDNA